MSSPATWDDDSRARPALISGSLLVHVLHDKHPGATRLHKLIKDVLQRRHNKELPWPCAWPKPFHAADGGWLTVPKKAGGSHTTGPTVSFCKAWVPDMTPMGACSCLHQQLA